MKITLSTILILIFFNIKAQNPNWSENIAPILYKHCTSCHHDGGLAPFSLIDYKDALNNSSGIKYAVSNKSMPPWPPDQNYRRLAHERILNNTEIQNIIDWVNNGSIQGDSNKAPVKPNYNSNKLISNPDLIVKTPKYTLQSNSDEYRCYPIKSNVTTDQYISEMEIIPGNGEVVHHVLIFQDISNTPFTLDALDTVPGYISFGGTGSNTSKLIGAWVPGQGLYSYPNQMGLKIPANSNIILQVHYPSGKSGQSDQTEVRFKYNTQTNVRNLYIDAVLEHGASMVNGPLYIPANQTKSFTSKYTVLADVSLLGVGPHMHLIGKKIKAYGILPVTKDTIKFINIENWDFHWQGFYQFKNVLKIPKGTVLYAEAFYDNTSNNLDNPNNPPKDVFVGEKTTDEMMLVYFTYALYQNGDEKIIIDSSQYNGINDYLVQDDISKLKIFPNPSSSYIEVIPNINSGIYNIELYTIVGKKIISTQSQIVQNEKFTINLENIPNGNYLIRVVGDKNIYIQKLQVQK